MWVVLSVFDKKAREYSALQIVRNVAVGVRQFSDAVRGAGETVIAAHPEDFQLVQVGTFDEESGLLRPIGERPVVIAEASHLVEVKNGVVPQQVG